MGLKTSQSDNYVPVPGALGLAQESVTANYCSALWVLPSSVHRCTTPISPCFAIGLIAPWRIYVPHASNVALHARSARCRTMQN